MDNTTKRLFDQYHQVHGQYLDEPDINRAQSLFDDFCRENLLPLVKDQPRESRILEIGSHKGYMLKWLVDQGFKSLVGVDLSPEDIETSKSYLVDQTELHAQDAFEFLASRENEFDLIIAKALLEHIEKDRIDAFLTLIAKNLRAGGKVILYVPNMDWLMASHERYLDFTHEVGFTRESMAAVLRLYFQDVVVKPVLNTPPSFLRAKILKPAAIKLIRLMLNVLGEGAKDCWFEYRSIVGIGTKK